jgi:hypothetical protein
MERVAVIYRRMHGYDPVPSAVITLPDSEIITDEDAYFTRRMQEVSQRFFDRYGYDNVVWYYKIRDLEAERKQRSFLVRAKKLFKK